MIATAAVRPSSCCTAVGAGAKNGTNPVTLNAFKSASPWSLWIYAATATAICPAIRRLYTPAAQCADILAVADACGLDRFDLWGMSYGGKVGRYLAAQSPRVRRCVLMGTPLGPGVAGQPRRDAIDFVAHWPPILALLQAGTLEPASLSPQDRETLANINVPVVLAWVTAMLDWPSVEPVDFLCPTLWLVGAEDPHAMESVETYRDHLHGSLVQVTILPGLDHMGVFEQVDVVLPLLLDFTGSPLSTAG